MNLMELRTMLNTNKMTKSLLVKALEDYASRSLKNEVTIAESAVFNRLVVDSAKALNISMSEINTLAREIFLNKENH